MEQMSERMPGKDVVAEIKGTVSSLETVVRNEVGTEAVPERLRIHYTKHTNWFCGIYFKPGKLLLSLYQHRPFNDLDKTRAPSFFVRTDVFPEIGHWFEEEWKHLTESKAADNIVSK